MKIKKIASVLCLTIMSLTMFVGCTYTDENGNKINPAGEKLFGDRSEQLPTLAMSDVDFSAQVKLKITPIAQDGHNLKSQAIAIMNGRINKDLEIPKLEVMLNNVQQARNEIFNFNVSEGKSNQKTELVNALDKYSTELTDYKNLLSQKKMDKQKVQAKIDSVIGALNIVKQYAQ